MPAEFGLALDECGWTEFEALLCAARRFHPSSIAIPREHIEGMIAGPHRDRLELSEGRVRARYGHSVVGITTTKYSPRPTLSWNPI
jgi:putative RNA 2'-phosphotransferase